MTTSKSNYTEASGTTSEASAVVGFISATNSIIVMLDGLADEIRNRAPQAADVVAEFTVLIAGEALGAISRWPS